MTTAPAQDLGNVGVLVERGLVGLRRQRQQVDTAEADARWATPGMLAKHLVPKTMQTPALDCIDAKLVKLRDTSDGRLIVTMAPQEGKSRRVTHDFIVWWLKHHPEARVVTASYGQRLATRNGRAVRRTIAGHPELGIRIAEDHGAANEWSLVDARTGKHTGGGLFSVGIGGGVTGQPADLLVIDDPIKSRAEADSELYRDKVWDWWTDEASARLAPGAPVVLVLTRWHEDDLAGRLLKEPDSEWELLNIPAQAQHDPGKGETDILGREPGEFMVSARGRTQRQWELRKKAAGSRTWEALYQGNPSSPQGSVFKRSWWQRYDQPQWMVRDDGSRVVVGFDEVIISWDMTFKGTEGADNVAGHVWGRRGADCYLLDRAHGRMDFVDTLAAFKALAARWPQALLKLVEDKANGPAVISMLGRSVPGIVPIEPHGGKEARAAAVSPLVEAGNVWLPASELCPWVDDVIEEAAGFPTAQHDDDVDCLTQALHRLVIEPLLTNEETWQPEEYDLTDARGYYASPV